MVEYLKLFTVAVVLFTLYTVLKRNTEISLEEQITSTVRGNYYIWHRCISSQLLFTRFDPQALWAKIGDASTYCQNYTGVGQLQVLEYPNNDESKYHILPDRLDGLSVIVSIGIGHDISAEQKLQMDLGNNNTLFFGADPIPELNAKLYGTIGKFFPFAISGESGLSKASVLKDRGYQSLDVVHMDLLYFLTQVIGGNHTLFDNIWIDAEGGEYSIFPMFYKDGKLDRNNVTICQINMEVHQPNDAQKEQFRVFINQILADEKYAFLKVTTAAGHWRMYFVNMDSDVCSRKYLVKIL